MEKSYLTTGRTISTGLALASTVGVGCAACVLGAPLASLVDRFRRGR